MKIPTIGELNNRITVQEKETTTNVRGGKDITWKNLFTLWAKVETTTGNDFKYGDVLDRKITHKITTRYNSGIVKNQRIMVDNDYFIISADPIKDAYGKKRFLLLPVMQTEADI